MTTKEYTARLLEIRIKVNELMDDMCITRNNNGPAGLERILNLALMGDLTHEKRGKFLATPAIKVADYTSTDYWSIKQEWM